MSDLSSSSIRFWSVLADTHTFRCRITGSNGRLIIQVESYRPEVSCIPAPSYGDQGCTELLGTLPIAPQRLLFTRQRKIPGVNTVYVPQGGKRFTLRK